MGGSGKFYPHTGPPTRDKCYLNINKKRSESEWYIISSQLRIRFGTLSRGFEVVEKGEL